MAVWAFSLSTTNFITRSLSPYIDLNGIQSFVRFGTLVGALAHRVLYPRWIVVEAIPQYISKRTSYFQF